VIDLDFYSYIPPAILKVSLISGLDQDQPTHLPFRVSGLGPHKNSPPPHPHRLAVFAFSAVTLFFSPSPAARSAKQTTPPSELPGVGRFLPFVCVRFTQRLAFFLPFFVPTIFSFMFPRFPFFFFFAGRAIYALSFHLPLCGASHPHPYVASRLAWDRCGLLVKIDPRVFEDPPPPRAFPLATQHRPHPSSFHLGFVSSFFTSSCYVKLRSSGIDQEPLFFEGLMSLSLS